MQAKPEQAQPEKRPVSQSMSSDQAASAAFEHDPGHVNQPAPAVSHAPSPMQITFLQRTVGNRMVGQGLQNSRQPTLLQRSTTAVAQRDKTSDKLKELDDRTKLLERKTAAIQLDLDYRARFGKKLATYKEIIFRLTGGFQTAMNGYQSAHGKQAAQDAVIDQIVTTLIVVAGAAVLEPFLSLSLGKLQAKLGKTSQSIAKIDLKAAIEKVENPINAAASGAGNTVTTSRAGNRAGNSQTEGVPAGHGAGAGGGDPVTFLSSNMAAVEHHTAQIEGAFSERAAAYEKLTAEQWDALGDQRAKYEELLKGLDDVALGDIDKLETPQTLAVKIELYLWAGWIKTHQPGVKGLQIGSQLAKRLKELGVESLAGVTFDTDSWIFMNHKPADGQWERNLLQWAQTWNQPITKGK